MCSLYPSKWKTSRICPIFKKGDRQNVENYRPISILNVFSKCFEIVLCDRLFFHIKSDIVPEQHGFVRGRSTVTNLTTFTSYVTDSFDRKAQVDTIYFDFSSAFDLVNHSMLILKLYQNFDIPLHLLLLLKSYLSDRSQFVTLNGVFSKCFNVFSGIPQGSNLGPMLFTLFINDLPDYLQHSKVLIFADDVKIFKRINDEDDVEALQSDIDSIIEWSETNKMKLNQRPLYY